MSLSATRCLAVAVACALTPLAGSARAQTAPSGSSRGGDQVRPDTHTDADPTKRDPSASSLASSYGQALRIARMLNNDRVVANLLARHGLTKAATEADVLDVVKAYEATGDPTSAAKFLRDRIKRFPTEKRSRVLLAELLSRSGDTAQALTVWRELFAALGKGVLSLEEIHTYARDLSRVGDVDGAYAALLTLRDKAPPDAKDYWLDVATLAWDRDDDAVAMLAYDKVYRADPKTLHAGVRLLALLADAERYDEALKIALAEHRRTGDAQPVLIVAHLRAGMEQWAKVKETLDAAEKETKPEGAPSLQQSEDFLLLRGDSSKQLGDAKGALEAFRRALAVSPTSIAARSNVLWATIETGDLQKVRQLAVSWRSASLREPGMWPVMAVAFATLDMVTEALPFFELQLRANPRDGRLLLDLADVLAKADRHALANDLRRRAVVALRADALKALRSPKPTPEELHLVESAATVVRERSGSAQGEKWLSAMRAANPRFRGQEETALDWYLGSDRPDFARRLLDRKVGPAKDFHKFRLALAMVDEDHSAIAALLDASQDVPPDERMHAAVILNNDRAAARAIDDGLAPGRTLPDEPAMREELARISYLHRPSVRGAGLYFHITGLDIVGGQAVASHDAFRGRLVYTATGVQMSDRSGLLNMPGPVNEGEAGVLYRHMSPRGVSEASAMLNYQDETPVVRASVFDQRMLTSHVGLTSELRVGQRIDDTSFLRLLAVRNAAIVGVRYDEARWYASADLEGREDQTRRYDHLAWDAVESAEFGWKFTTHEPHLSAGLQAQASQRDTRTDLPGSVASFLPARLDPQRALPPSFQLLGAVVHLSRGDFLERYRPDRAPFPRYDCEAAFGVLFPDTDPALHVLCGVSVRAPAGYTSLFAFYNRGIAGVTNNENAEVALSYTIPF